MRADRAMRAYCECSLRLSAPKGNDPDSPPRRARRVLLPYSDLPGCDTPIRVDVANRLFECGAAGGDAQRERVLGRGQMACPRSFVTIRLSVCAHHLFDLLPFSCTHTVDREVEPLAINHALHPLVEYVFLVLGWIDVCPTNGN